MDAALPGLAAEDVKILFRAQHGVDMGIIGGIVPMVGGGFKNGAEVQRGHAQPGQVVQLGGNTCQRTAEKVPVPDLTVGIRLPLGHVVPLLVNPAVSHQAIRLGNGQPPESIWKNMVRHAAAEPLRRMGGTVGRQLPGVKLGVTAVACLIQKTTGAVVPPQAEVIPAQLRLRRGGDGGGKAQALPLRTQAGHFHLLGPAGKLMEKNQRAMGKVLLEQGTAAKGDKLPAGDGAERGFVLCGTGIENKGFTHRRMPPKLLK